MSMTPEKAEALRRPFPKSSIGKLPKGGIMLDYVGHAATTDRLLQVDPEWSWEPVAYDALGLPAFDQHHNLWIRLTICGVTRLGVGDGKSPKECIGDAIRNAAMRFGVALDLWAKEDLEGFAAAAETPKEEEVPVAPPVMKKMSRPAEGITSAQITKMAAAMGDLALTDRRAALSFVTEVVGRPIETRNDLTKAEAHRVIDALEKELQAQTERKNVKEDA
jgi:hypothetical protein